MTSPKPKDDNKTFRETHKAEIAKNIVAIIAPTLTNLEGYILTGIFIEGKSFSEIGMERQLTSSRIKKVAEMAMIRLNNYLATFQKRQDTLLKAIEDYSVLQDR